MDNRQRLIDMVKGNCVAVKIYVQQPDGRYKYFDEMLQKTTGRSLTQSELKQIALVVDEETAKFIVELKKHDFGG